MPKHSNNLICETVGLASLLPGWTALVAGAIPFVLCYFIIPLWLAHRINNYPNSVLAPVFNQLINEMFIKGVKGTGIACLIGSALCAIRNRNSTYYARRREISILSTLSELLALLFK